MICPSCGGVFEGNTCPYCGRTFETPPEHPETPASQPHPGFAFVVLAMMAGVMLLEAIGFLAVGYFAVSNMQSIRTPEFPVNEWEGNLQTTTANNAEKDTETAWGQPQNTYESGDYEVGTDIPAGTYVIISEGGDFYAAVYANKSMSSERKIFGGWHQNNCYVILEEGQYLHFSHSTLYDPEALDMTFSPFTQHGMFLVGRDVMPGTYTLVPDTEGFGGEYTIYSSITSPGAVVRTSGYFEENDTEEITLAEGEYIELRFCVLEGSDPPSGGGAYIRHWRGII